MNLSIRKGGQYQQEIWQLNDARPNVIGRPDKDRILPDINLWLDGKVSRPHAKIWYENDSWWIEDLQSKRGTFIDGRRIREGDKTRLVPDTEIQVGDTVLTLIPSDRHRFQVQNLVIEVDTVNTINFSLVHCGIPFVTKVIVQNRGTTSYHDMKLRLVVEGYGESDIISIQNLDSESVFVVKRPTFHFNYRSFEYQVECSHARLAIYFGTCAIGEISLWVLAHNEWSLEEKHRYALASFVLPNHPLIRQVELEAQKYVQKITNGICSTFHELTTGNGENRVEQALEAFYRYFQTDCNLSYRHEPPSFESNSQKISLPHQVLSDSMEKRGEATCIDMVLTFAACMEYSGVHPLIVIVEIAPSSYHALLACWKENAKRIEPIISDPQRIIKDAVILDCSYCLREWDVKKNIWEILDFKNASLEAQRCLKINRFLYALDITVVRSEGITPLPFAGEPQFSPLVASALAKSRELAVSFSNKYYGSVHLILALLKIKDGLLSQALEVLHISTKDFQEKLDHSLRKQGIPDCPSPDSTLHFEQIKISAVVYAKKVSCAVVLEEHIVLALLEVESQATDNAIKSAGIHRDILRNTIQQVCSSYAHKLFHYSIYSQFHSKILE